MRGEPKCVWWVEEKFDCRKGGRRRGLGVLKNVVESCMSERDEWIFDRE